MSTRPPTIIMGCFMHETNTFSVRRTDRAAFERGGVLWLEGDACLHEGDGTLRGTNTESLGFIETAEREGWRLVPTVHGEANPSGRVTDDCFDANVAKIVVAIARSFA